MRLRLALLAPLALAASAVPASAGSITVPGCYGAGSTIYCDPTVEYNDPPGVEFYSENVPVCASTCYTVPVTLVRLGDSEAFRLCYSWRDGSGNPHETCDDDILASIAPVSPDLRTLICKYVDCNPRD